MVFMMYELALVEGAFFFFWYRVLFGIDAVIVVWLLPLRGTRDGSQSMNRHIKPTKMLSARDNQLFNY